MREWMTDLGLAFRDIVFINACTLVCEEFYRTGVAGLSISSDSDFYRAEY